MKNFIIVDTWNGVGYSDSNAKVMRFKNSSEAANYCLEAAYEQAKSMGTKCYSHKNDKDVVDAYGYQDSDDEDDDDLNAGAFHFVEVTSQTKGVILNPIVNDFYVMETEEQWKEAIDLAIEKGDCEEDEKERLKSNDADGLYIHSGSGCSGDAQFIELNVSNEILNQRELEYYSEGTNDTENEVWKHSDGRKFLVPIEIVRDFDNAIEIK